MASRSKQREVALQTLYMYEMHKHTITIKELLAFPWIKNTTKFPFTTSLVTLIIDNLISIDTLYSKYIIDNHEKAEITIIDKILLRLGTGEITYLDTDSKVVIDEIITLSKRYSHPTSYKLLNGVLNRVSLKHI